MESTTVPADTSSVLFDDLQLSSSSNEDDNDASFVVKKRKKWLSSRPTIEGKKKRRHHHSSSSSYEDTMTTSSDTEESEYDPDIEVIPGCSSWGVIMERKHTEKVKTEAEERRRPVLAFSSSSLSPSSFFISSRGGTVDNSVIPDRILSIFSSLLEKEKFQFSQSVSFLRMIRKQVNAAMKSTFFAMLSSSGIRRRIIQVGGGNGGGKFEEEEKWNAAMSRMAKLLSNIAAASNYTNNFQPAASTFTKIENHHSLFTICSKVIFYREIHSIISLYLLLVYIQRAMNNDNINSNGYPEEMVTKMLDIIGKIPREEMSQDKYVSVGRDALYLYQKMITDVTGPKHSKRLRTPQQQADFCYVIAMLVNDMSIDSDLTLAGKTTNLVQFASTVGHPAYRLAVHKVTCVFNSSYSVYKVLNLERKLLIHVNQILTILSVRNRSLSERKPRTLTQSVFLYLRPNLKDKLRVSGLTTEESSLGTVVKLVSRKLRFEGVDQQSLEDGCSIIAGSYDTAEGVTLKCLGSDIKDIKILGLATLMVDKMRKRIKRHLPFY